MRNQNQLANHIRCVDRAEKVFIRIIAFLLILSAVYFVSTVYDVHKFTKAGLGGIRFHDFKELGEINPDIAAWLRLDGTNIDHPVVLGKDNYEYLSKDFEGNDYAGGCIFVDASASPGLTDRYIVIHGHHMAGGAMFGDLEKYLDPSFFEENKTGQLLTPECDYSLCVAGAGVADAYNGEIYHVSAERERPVWLIDQCRLKRDLTFETADKLITLSTCSGDMSTERIIVLLRARPEGVKNG